MDSLKIGIVGVGFVGGAIKDFLLLNNFKLDETLFLYDKYKNGGIGQINNLLICDIIFLALPTMFSHKYEHYDINSIEETLEYLMNNDFQNTVVIKSTVEPTVTDSLASKYKLNLVHNPEFLTARTATEDFKNQKHIVLGKSDQCLNDKFELVVNFFKHFFNQAEISLCQAKESESMKLFLNNFYAVKVQYFTEIYLLCNELKIDYNNVKNLMLKNNWINPMHTHIPGPDGKISYGGLCFPKDTTALMYFMDRLDIPNSVIKSTVNERNKMRSEDNENILS